MPKTKDKVAGVAGTAQPYVERALHDEELRDHVKQAYAAAREIYDELVGPRGVTDVATRVATRPGDPGQPAHRDRRAAPGREPPPGREASTTAAGTLLLLVGVVVGLLFNPVTGPETRRWLKQTLFGGDEFGFESDPSGNGPRAAAGSALGAVEHRERHRQLGDARPRHVDDRARAFIARVSEPGSRPFAVEMSLAPEQDRAGWRRAARLAPPAARENGTAGRIRTSSSRFQASRYFVGLTAPS